MQEGCAMNEGRVRTSSRKIPKVACCEVFGKVPGRFQEF